MQIQTVGTFGSVPQSHFSDVTTFIATNPTSAWVTATESKLYKGPTVLPVLVYLQFHVKLYSYQSLNKRSVSHFTIFTVTLLCIFPS